MLQVGFSFRENNYINKYIKKKGKKNKKKTLFSW